ncbi:MAG: hypothetical protein M0C28_31530 [Candidatus Moduliflexus flocculans]|nr:hypothetical protein [Candidatus Moduliflexus flocculans]
MTINVQGLSDSMSLVLTKPPAAGQAKGKVLAGPVTVNMLGVSLAVDAQKKGKGPLSAGGTLKSRQGARSLTFRLRTSRARSAMQMASSR